jgi:hypothetical protein
LLSLVILDVITTIITAATTVALYFELRRVKEGLSPELMAAEFD